MIDLFPGSIFILPVLKTGNTLGTRFEGGKNLSRS